MQYSRYSTLIFASLSALLVVVYGGLDAVAAPKSRKIELVNNSGKKLAIDWVNPKSGAMVPLHDDFQNGASTTFDSFVSHTFAIHEPRNETCTSENGGSCKVQYITVSENNQQVAVVKRGLQVEYEDTKTRARDQVHELTEDCRQLASSALTDGYDAQEVMKELAECLEEEATLLFQEKNEEIAFEAEIRLSLSANLENHTCSEPNRETSEPKEVRVWTHHGEDIARDVYVFHDRPASQIHVLKNFISEEECQAIEAAAKPKLHRGTVADGSGGSRLSDHRKAWQAGLRPPWNKEAEGNPIARVVRRIYDYTNDAVGYNLTVDGQEDLMSIQYFGLGKDSDESPDQYRPHCDGECDGLPHKTGGRIATMVMYCTVPELGGATNFQNSGVFVKPEVGAAAFFSYMDPATKLQETGFTSHSGCPVIEGTKRIAVQWMRYGVDNENPWDSFNTLTIKKDDEEDC